MFTNNLNLLQASIEFKMHEIDFNHLTVRHEAEDSVFPKIGKLKDSGGESLSIRINIFIILQIENISLILTSLDISEESDVFEVEENQSNADTNQYGSEDDNTGQYQRRDAVRALWKRAIKEQILLIRMERENTKLQGQTSQRLFKMLESVKEKK